jgi:Mnd1 HTH domain
MHHFHCSYHLSQHKNHHFLYSVADINQSLVDDGLVDKEKIGGTNYFWSFPAKMDRKMELQHQKALEHIEILKKNIAGTEAALMDAKRGREESDPDAFDISSSNSSSIAVVEAPLPTRANKLARLEEIAKEKAACEKELEALRENDPQVLADLEKELQLVLQYVEHQRCLVCVCLAHTFIVCVSTTIILLHQRRQSVDGQYIHVQRLLDEEAGHGLETGIQVARYQLGV